MLSHARILIVDDRLDNIELLRQMLGTAGYTAIEGITQPAQALKRVLEFDPDLIVLDLMMSGMDGYTFLQHLAQLVPADAFLPVLVVTADGNIESRRRALSLGATDFVLRPHEVFDVTLRVRNLLRTRFLHLEVLSRNETLESLVTDRTRRLEESREELKLAQLDIVERLALVGEHHDDDTGAHTRRVARTSRLLCQRLGLPSEETEVIRRAAPLHDVGKIGISDAILRKPGKLTPEEFEAMKSHCEIGAALLNDGRSELMRIARNIAISHHERWNGKGYPFGLQSEAIPIEGRIVAVADVFDALTHERPYKAAWTPEDAASEIISQSGAQFDPTIVDVFRDINHQSIVDLPEEDAN